jgi:hypothetical protein
MLALRIDRSDLERLAKRNPLLQKRVTCDDLGALCNDTWASEESAPSSAVPSERRVTAAQGGTSYSAVQSGTSYSAGQSGTSVTELERKNDSFHSRRNQETNGTGPFFSPRSGSSTTRGNGSREATPNTDERRADPPLLVEDAGVAQGDAIELKPYTSETVESKQSQQEVVRRSSKEVIRGLGWEKESEESPAEDLAIESVKQGRRVSFRRSDKVPGRSSVKDAWIGNVDAPGGKRNSRTGSPQQRMANRPSSSSRTSRPSSRASNSYNNNTKVEPLKEAPLAGSSSLASGFRRFSVASALDTGFDPNKIDTTSAAWGGTASISSAVSTQLSDAEVLASTHHHSSHGNGSEAGGHGHGEGGNGHGHGHNSHAALMIWLGILIDSVPESVVLGILASTATSGGLLTFVIGVFLSNLPEAMSSSGTMASCGFKKSRILLMWSSIVVLTGIGASIGATAFPAGSEETRNALIAIAAIEGLCGGAMLAMIANTALPEAFEQGGDVVGVSTLLGFLSALMVSAISS